MLAIARHLKFLIFRPGRMNNPTVSNLANDSGFALETGVDESIVRKIIPELRRAGAEAIVEYALNKVIP